MLYLRYSAAGKVEECRLIDFQLTRVASPALDLNYMFYCSLDGDRRRKEMTNFLTKYYAFFASVMASAGVAMKFTGRQLMKEFYDKNVFGLLMGLMLIPMILTNSDQGIEIENLSGTEEETKKEFSDQVMKQVQSNPLLIPRLLSMFDDMIESKVIN